MTDVTATTITRPSDGPGSVAGPERGLYLLHAPAGLALAPTFQLSRPLHVLGRRAPADGLRIDEGAVSRLHAAIDAGRSGARIRDLGSRNGTFVNGARVEEASLAHGDDVRIGDTLFLYLERDFAAHAAYALANDGPHGALTLEGAIGGLSVARLSREVEAAAASANAVLVVGETGVGKELVAHGVHRATKRRGDLAVVNCAAIPQGLVESELFGVERGAFTGADRRREGLVRSADGGTLFLDEVGELDADTQAKLLRVLGSREVMPVGATRPVPVDVRIVCATNRDLRRHVADGGFRADLFARIAGYTIHVPPLRERREDLPRLVRHFVTASGKPELVPTIGFMERIVRHGWPFNVRELASVVSRAANLARTGELLADALPPEVAAAPAPRSVPPSSGSQRRRRAPTREELVAQLRASAGNVAAVGRALARDPAQIHRWMKQHRLDPDDFR
jgi:transcriptional regulator with GAF, ATPase, and Fis domain